jgi:23S rRNA pseudouridine955/2504/2580 synthase
MNDVRHFTVKEDEDGQRLDRWLKQNLPRTPYALLQKMVRTGQVRIDGKRAKTDTRLVMGQDIRIPPAEERTEKLTTFDSKPNDKQFLEAITLYDDGEILILNKPYGLPVQGGPNIRRHIDGMLNVMHNLKGVRPRLVHRLDRDTSGILICARSLRMTQMLTKIFEQHTIRKVYWALVSPSPALKSGEVNAALIKGEGARKEAMVIDDKNGKSSRTLYRVIEKSGKEAAFVTFWPRTGRMHQIRVHAADGLGCPILGDEKYRGMSPLIDEKGLDGRLHLHAARIVFEHPSKKVLMDIKAPLPPELVKSWKAFGFDPSYQEDPFAEIAF